MAQTHCQILVTHNQAHNADSRHRAPRGSRSQVVWPTMDGGHEGGKMTRVRVVDNFKAIRLRIEELRRDLNEHSSRSQNAA